MAFNYARLRGRICEKFRTHEEFAKTIGISPMSLSAKLNNHVHFTQKEILDCAKSLGISPKEIHEYFFCRET